MNKGKDLNLYRKVFLGGIKIRHRKLEEGVFLRFPKVTMPFINLLEVEATEISPPALAKEGGCRLRIAPHLDPLPKGRRRFINLLKIEMTGISLSRLGANLYPQVSYNMGIAIKQGSEGFGD